MSAIDILSPLPGVFYRKPAPDQAPFIDTDMPVQPNTVIGSVEVMKQFNEIEAECSGTLVAFYVEDGAEVEAGQLLAKVQP